MRIDAIQPNLLSILTAMPELAGVTVLIDDGKQATPMEDALKSVGIAILIMQPQGMTQAQDQSRAATQKHYVTAVWLRTDPKRLNDAGTAAKWNPLTLEQAIITAVIKWNSSPSNPPPSLWGFYDEQALTDWMDTGNNSRDIYFSTPVPLIPQ